MIGRHWINPQGLGLLFSLFLCLTFMSNCTSQERRLPPGEGYFWKPDSSFVVNRDTIRVAGHWVRKERAIDLVSVKEVFDRDNEEMEEEMDIDSEYSRGSDDYFQERDEYSQVQIEAMAKADLKYEVRKMEQVKYKSEIVAAAANFFAEMFYDPMDQYRETFKTGKIQIENYLERVSEQDFDREKEDPLVASDVYKDNSRKLYFYESMNLQTLNLSSAIDYIFVIDTLKLGKNSSITFDNPNTLKRTPILNLIVNNLILEQPMVLSIPTLRRHRFKKKIEDGGIFNLYVKRIDYVGSFNKPPIFFKRIGSLNYVIEDKKAKNLLNQGYIYGLEQIIAKFNVSKGESQAFDCLVDHFKSLKSLVNYNELTAENTRRFNSVCTAFDTKNLVLVARREIDGNTVLIDRNFLPTKYYCLNPKAGVTTLTVQENTKIGSLTFKSTGDEEPTLRFEIQLDSGSIVVDGYHLSREHPPFIRVNQQTFKIQNSTVHGDLYPINNSLFCIEIKAKDVSKTLLAMFPRQGCSQFIMKFSIEGTEISFEKKIMLKMDQELLDKMTYSERDLDVWAYDPNQSVIKINSGVEAYQNEEKELKYVEIFLTISSSVGNFKRGPYHLSSYSTYGSEVSIPFLRGDNYSVEISGRAVYKEGERTMKTFTSNDLSVYIDDSLFDPLNQ